MTKFKVYSTKKMVLELSTISLILYYIQQRTNLKTNYFYIQPGL